MGEKEKQEERDKIQAESEKITRIGAYSNVSLAGIKLLVGVYSGSVAMLADAAHSLADLFSDGITLWAVKIARQPADNSHPHGKGRIETVGALAVSALLVITGAGMAMHGYESLIEGNSHLQHVEAVLGVAAASIVMKETLYWLTLRAGQKARSKVLIANAWHHRADSVSSVVAFIGTAGVICGYPFFDAVSAIVVAGMIAKVGASLAIESLNELMDKDVDPHLRKEIAKDLQNIIGDFKGITGFQQLRTRRMGPYVNADVHLEVNSTMSITAAHDVANRVRQMLLNSHEEISDVIISVGPEGLDKNSPAKEMRTEFEIQKDVMKIVKECPQILSISHYTQHIIHGRLMVELEVCMHPDLKIKQASMYANVLREEIERIPDVQDCDIHLELNETLNKER